MTTLAPTYTAAGDGFIIGKHYAKGEPVPLTPTQAKYLVAPYGDSVIEDKPAPKEPEAVKPKDK